VLRSAHLAEGCLALDLLALKHVPDLVRLFLALVAQLLLQLLVARNFFYVKDTDYICLAKGTYYMRTFERLPAGCAQFLP
jgi:hypothetical protein